MATGGGGGRGVAGHRVADSDGALAVGGAVRRDAGDEDAACEAWRAADDLADQIACCEARDREEASFRALAERAADLAAYHASVL